MEIRFLLNEKTGDFRSYFWKSWHVLNKSNLVEPIFAFSWCQCNQAVEKWVYYFFKSAEQIKTKYVHEFCLLLKIKPWVTGQVTQWLSGWPHIAIQRTRVWLPIDTCGRSQLPVTLALGDPTPCSGFCGQCTHVCTHTCLCNLKE